MHPVLTHIHTPEEFFPELREGLQAADVDFDACEVKLLHYNAGDIVPIHTHSDETLKVVLDGQLRFFDADGVIGEMGAGQFYVCGETPYGVEALAETYMLLFQKPGTVRH